MCFGKLSTWMYEQEKAIDTALDRSHLNELLPEARAGCPVAKEAMVAGTHYLVYEHGFAWVERSSKRRLDDIIGRYINGQHIAINRLIANDATDVIDSVNAVLVNVPKKQFREDNSNICVPASTKSSRKKEEKEPYFNLVRVGGCLTDGAFADAESDEGGQAEFSASREYQGPLTTQSGKPIRLASKYRGYEEGPEMVDLLDEFTEEQRAIVPLLVENVPLSKIAEEKSQSLYNARKLKTQVQGRYGGTPGIFDAIVEMANEAEEQSDVCRELVSVENTVVEANGLELAVSV